MPPKITGIAHVELSVLDATVAWYGRVLGAKDVWRGIHSTPWSRYLDELGIEHEFSHLRPR